MKESLTSFEERIASSALYLESMCALSPKKTGIDKVFIQLRPQPDKANKQVSLKIRIGDGLFKKKGNCGVYSVPDLELIAGVEVLNSKQRAEVSEWVIKNQQVIKSFWSNPHFMSDDLFDNLVK